MKTPTLPGLCRELLAKPNRAKLAVALGAAAMVLILLSIFFARLGFAAQKDEERRRKVHRQPQNTVKNGRKAG